MSIRVAIDRESRLLRSTLGGTVTLLDFLQGRDLARAHPDWSPSLRHLLDFTQVTQVDMSVDTLRDLAAMKSLFDPGTLQVVVLDADAPHAQTLREYLRFAGATGRDVRIVGTLDEAMTLLRDA